MWIVLDVARAGKPPGKLSYRHSRLSSVPPLSLRLLKGNNNCTVEDSEDSKENSEDKENCSDSHKEVGVFVCVALILC